MPLNDYGARKAHPKDPSDVDFYDFAFDGEGWTSGEAITGVPTVVVDPIGGDPSPLAVGTISLVGTPARTVRAFFSAGTAGNLYRVTVTFATSGSRTLQRSFAVPVAQL